jgi:hypothetical protein
MLKLFLKITKFLSLVLFSLLILFLAGWLFFGEGIHSPGKTIEPRVAFWMEHAWASAELQNYEKLLNEIEALNITDLYFHVGPISEEGKLATDLNLGAMKLEDLSTINYAWIGQIRAKIELSDPAIRSKIVDACVWLVDSGFDGIHVDIEPVRPGDEDFLLLIQEIKAKLPQVPLSVAMDQWQPEKLSDLVAKAINTSIESYWTTQQVENVAEFADQLVVMTYDTGFNRSDLYSWWVEQQTLSLSRILDSNTELFIGLPTYDEGSSINPHAENLESGLKGFQAGIENLRSKKNNIQGLALYPYWEMSTEEWDTLKSWIDDYRSDLPDNQQYPELDGTQDLNFF